MLISAFPRCAKIVAPSGGLKDTLAPVLLRSVPANNSKNFKGEKLSLTFNEYIVLKDIQKKLVVSPPMIKRPEIIQKGKTIEVRLKEPLKEETTYTFYYGDAIVDNNEGNPLKSFEHVFSTGNKIDTLAAIGKVVNALTLLPEEGVLVMLYDKMTDSVPYKELPVHIAQTDKKGIFVLKNLGPKDYKIFALNDGNANYRFDAVAEDIAFTDSILKKETLKGFSRLDTSRLSRKGINLNMFKEESRIQALTGFSRDFRKKISLAFTKKPLGDFNIRPLNVETNKSWYLKETNSKEDSLTFWITDDKVSAIDTLRMVVSYMKTDSLERLQPKQDTLRMVYVDPEVPKSRRSDKKSPEKKVYLKVKSSLRNEQIAKPIIPFELTFPVPLKKIDYSLITFTNLKDSSKITGLKFEEDSINHRTYRLLNNWASDVPYRFDALPGAFTSLDNLITDTLRLKFKGANPENFGSLIITLLNAKKSTIVELCDERGTKVITSKKALPGEKTTLTFIDPGKYIIRFVEDLNMNGKWDTGWYLRKIQPEKIFQFEELKTKGIIVIRANWENEISFDFDKL